MCLNIIIESGSALRLRPTRISSTWAGRNEGSSGWKTSWPPELAPLLERAVHENSAVQTCCYQTAEKTRSSGKFTGLRMSEVLGAVVSRTQ